MTDETLLQEPKLNTEDLLGESYEPTASEIDQGPKKRKLGELYTGERVQTIDEFEPEAPGIMSHLEDAFLLENEVVSGVNAFTRMLKKDQLDQSFDADFDPISRGESLGLDLDDIEELQFTPNKAVFDFLVKEKQKELDAKQRLAEGGASAVVAELAAGIISPLTLLSVGGIAYKVGQGGVTLGRVAGISALTGAGDAAISEAILQSSQFERTAGETALTIAGGAVLTSMLGTGGAMVLKSIAKRQKKTPEELAEELAKALEEDFAATGPFDQGFTDSDGDMVELYKSVSAAASEVPLTKEQQGIYTNAAVAALVKTTGKLSPAVRLATSKSTTIRTNAEKLLEFSLIRNKNLEGIPTQQAAETHMLAYKGMDADGIKGRIDAYKAYRKEVGRKAAVPPAEFNELVSYASRRNDSAADLGVDAVTQKAIEKAAKATRESLYEPMKALLTDPKVKMLPEDIDPETAPSYLNRMWSAEKIKANESKFKLRVEQWADGEIDKIISTSEEILKRKSASSAEKAKAKQTLDFIRVEGKVNYAAEIGREMFNKITRLDYRMSIHHIKASERGPLKDRTFNIPDLMVEDFLENDINILASAFARKAGAEYELTKAFGVQTPDGLRLDFQKLRDDVLVEREKLAKEIDKKYAKKAREATTAKEKAKIEKKRVKESLKLNNDINDEMAMFETLFDKVRGTYTATAEDPDSTWIRALAFTRNLNYVTKLGGVTTSSFPDAAMPMYVHGFSTYMKGALIPMIKTLTGSKFMANMRDEARSLGLATEGYTQIQQKKLFGVGDTYTKGSGAEKFLENVANNFGKYTGLNYWNDTARTLSFMTSHHRLMGIVNKTKLTSKDTKWITPLGIGEVDLPFIRSEIAKHGFKDGDLTIPNIKNWDNRELARKVTAFFAADVNRTIVTKSVGDVPIMADTAVGKTLFQFKTFGLSSNQKVLMAGMQRNDSEFYQGLTGLVTLGMMTYYFKTIESGRELSDDPLVWIQEGVDRSGIISMLTWANSALLEPAGLGLSSVTEGAPSRMAANYGASGLLGPTAGTITSLFKTGRMFRDLATGNPVAASDIAGARRLIPHNNNTVVRQGFDAIEEGLANTLGE